MDTRAERESQIVDHVAEKQGWEEETTGNQNCATVGSGESL